MPPIYQKLNDPRITHFQSLRTFDKFIDEKTVRCKCGVTVRLDRPFKITNFERHIKSKNCILGVDKQQSLYVFFNQNTEEEPELELNESLPCIGLFGDLYTEYVTRTPEKSYIVKVQLKFFTMYSKHKIYYNG